MYMNYQFDKDGWPLVWPTLTKADINKYKLHHGTSSCAVGWIKRICSASPNKNLLNTVEQELKDMLGLTYQSIAYWNDNIATEAQVARALNKLGKSLGYIGADARYKERRMIKGRL